MDAEAVLIRCSSCAFFAMNMPEADERLAAAEALTRIGPRAIQATPWLIKALRDKNHYVRRSVAVALGSIGEQAEPAAPFLIEALSDSEPTVQVFAAAALCGIGSGEDRVVSALIERLKTRESVVRFGLQRIFGVLALDATDTLRNAIDILDHASGPSGVDSDAEAPVRLFLETVKKQPIAFRVAARQAVGKIGQDVDEFLDGAAGSSGHGGR